MAKSRKTIGIFSAAVVLAVCRTASAQSEPAQPPASPAQPAVGSPSAPAQSDSASAATPVVSLPDQIAAILAAPAVARDHWGIAVTALDGTPVYSLNDAQLFQPASNAKLFTTAAALALLGPDHRFKTQVIASGDLDKQGVLHGDLLLVGSGDAGFGSAGLPYAESSPRAKPASPSKAALRPPANIADIEHLADTVVAKGLHAIQGNVVGDDQLFSREGYPDTWQVGDVLWSYGAPVSALTIHDNTVDVTIAPDPARATRALPALITTSPSVPYYTVQNQVFTMSLGTGGCDARLLFRRPVGSKALTIAGDIAPRAATCTEHIAIEDPAEYAALALKSALERRGVRISGGAIAQHWDPMRLPGTAADQTSRDNLAKFFMARPNASWTCEAQPVSGSLHPKQTVLATHTSPPLIEDLTYTNKVSQNLHAELFLRDLGAHFNPCGGGDVPHSLAALRQFLVNAGIDPGDFVFYDGSGLSLHDLVTPRAVATLLSYAASDPKTGQPQPWFAAWKASLPIGGEDGTLDDRFTQPPLKDHVFAKTGTLGETRALSGYLDCASGRSVIFSILVGNHQPSTSDDREAMDKIVAAIQAAE